MLKYLLIAIMMAGFINAEAFCENHNQLEFVSEDYELIEYRVKDVYVALLLQNKKTLTYQGFFSWMEDEWMRPSLIVDLLIEKSARISRKAYPLIFETEIDMDYYGF